jgi:hypothetical protein
VVVAPPSGPVAEWHELRDVTHADHTTRMAGAVVPPFRAALTVQSKRPGLTSQQNHACLKSLMAASESPLMRDACSFTVYSPSKHMREGARSWIERGLRPSYGVGGVAFRKPSRGELTAWNGAWNHDTSEDTTGEDTTGEDTTGEDTTGENTGDVTSREAHSDHVKSQAHIASALSITETLVHQAELRAAQLRAPGVSLDSVRNVLPESVGGEVSHSRFVGGLAVLRAMLSRPGTRAPRPSSRRRRRPSLPPVST